MTNDKDKQSIMEAVNDIDTVKASSKILIATGLGGLLGGPIGMVFGFGAGVIISLVTIKTDEDGEPKENDKDGEQKADGNGEDDDGDDPKGE